MFAMPVAGLDALGVTFQSCIPTQSLKYVLSHLNKSAP